MKTIESLDRKALVEIAKVAQSWLYLGETMALDNEAMVEVWDPDHEWSPVDTCEALAAVLSDYQLVPQFLGDKPNDCLLVDHNRNQKATEAETEEAWAEAEAKAWVAVRAAEVTWIKAKAKAVRAAEAKAVRAAEFLIPGE